MKFKKAAYITGIALITILIIFCGTKKKEKARLSNIILITVDALRADHLSAYGYPYQTSPNIDEFANKSTLFEYAYCPIPKTSASFASLMTGLHPFIHKTKPNRGFLDEKYITLAEALKLKGYYNFAIVDNANVSKNFNFHQGFDEYAEVWNDIEKKVESTACITEKVVEFFKNNKKSPFFLWVHYIETHSPYLPPDQFIEERPKGRIINNVQHKIIASQRKYLDENSDEGYFLSRYDGAVKYIDAEFKKIIDLIFKKGYQKNSIIIFSSDHGEELGEHNFFYNHGPLTFNSSARVPLIIFFPEKKSRRIRYPVSLMDIYPTLLAEAGLSLPYKIQGINLFEKPKQRLIFIKGHLGTRSVVYNNYHLVKVFPNLSKQLDLENEYFFDIYKDPLEKKNASADKKDLQNFMDEKYMEFYNKHGYLNKIKEDKKPSLSKKELENLKALGYIR